MADDKIRIQWFPGHMTKAKREMQEKLNMVDMVIELRDARIPSASKNPMIEELCQNKPRLIVLSKKDKADAAATKLWCSALQNETTRVVALDILKENIIARIVEESRLLMQAKIERMKRRGIRPRAIRAMVVGVPNVGKSTFINRISKKKVAVTGDRPGVTRALQWSKVNQNLELLDTPGVLWPKFEDETVGVLLAITGAIRDEILPLEEIAAWAMRYLIANHKEALQQRYDIAVCENPYIMLERIAEKRGFMRKGEMDEKRTIEAFLRELRDDKLGRITWEMPYADSE
ncbi:ribosome biogenesis GTPase YlqF [[Clostridium] innocuum]|uniref:ribosome biogenesis GTPase YlqF n=1 Tax=Clostridium innocuum TaxID=1522 RepID=UPI0021475493|nr:ribosome biogenesis GTPase YlqF [[Clostridium] innocuum]MCR0181945.1 ribosome biogenesis GTPase YlqF [[Clostridium] innocuum]MCR0273142.1 ribosome biogenesis GTPase YlqF [[Clostridium] innocuum]